MKRLVLLVALALLLVPAVAHAKTVHYAIFASPDRQVGCVIAPYIVCAAARPDRVAYMDKGRVGICNSTLPTEYCQSNTGTGAKTLHYGDRSVVGRTECRSSRAGIACRSRGKGFLVSARSIAALGTPGDVNPAGSPLGFPEGLPDDGISRPSQPPFGYVSSGHSCTVVTGARVRCWGGGTFGELGDGRSATPGSPVPNQPRTAIPLEVAGIGDATAVTSGGFHSCALRAGGTVACWGYGADGELGDGTRSDSATPVAVKGIGGAVALSAGGEHTCSLLAGGAVSCWGQNSDGELGDGTRVIRTAPVTVRGLSGAIAISAGANHTCALLAGGAVSCWGRGIYGELGNGTKQSSPVPVPVQGLTGATAVSAGGHHTCAIVAGGAVVCWGNGIYGNLGVGGRPEAVTTPVAVPGITGATQVSAGGYHTCALVPAGVSCWGRGLDGQVGTGKALGSLTPFTVLGVSGVAAISTGPLFTCATLAGGTVTCWGAGALRLTPLAGLPAPAPTSPVTQPPVFGRTAEVAPVSGAVLVRVPGTTAFVPLSASSTLPVGTEIDATNGRVRLTAVGPGGRLETGEFYGGVFKLSQVSSRVTVLTLSGPLPACRKAAAGAKPPPRSLWGDAKGSFRIKGRRGAATVRGTRWHVQDLCAGTRITVARGVVSVDDLVRHRTFPLRAPRSVLIRPRR